MLAVTPTLVRALKSSASAAGIASSAAPLLSINASTEEHGDNGNRKEYDVQQLTDAPEEAVTHFNHFIGGVHETVKILCPLLLALGFEVLLKFCQFDFLTMRTFMQAPVITRTAHRTVLGVKGLLHFRNQLQLLGVILIALSHEDLHFVQGRTGQLPQPILSITLADLPTIGQLTHVYDLTMKFNRLHINHHFPK